MALISQGRIVWQTGGGGTGYSVLNFTVAATQAEADVRGNLMGNFAQNIDVVMPSAVTWSIDEELRILDDTDGSLQGTFAISPTNSSGIGTGGTTYAMGVGGSIVWDTGAIVAGRRARGRTFIVPMADAGYDVNGTLVEAVRTNIQGPATTLAGSGDLVVWSRPTPDRVGTSNVVTSGRASDDIAWLRTRKT